jgi:peroxiredoxin
MRVLSVQARRWAGTLGLAFLALNACDQVGGDADGVRAAPRQERSLPRFDGVTLDGEQISTDLFERRRGVILLVGRGAEGADELAELVRGLEADAAKVNVAFLGVSSDPDRERARRFAKQHQLGFPILHDPGAGVRGKLRIEGRKAALIVVDGEGYMLLGFAGVSSQVGIEAYEDAVREALRMPKEQDTVSVSFGVRPAAPAFTVEDLEGKKLSLQSLEGKVVVVVFFLHTCPHCHDALRFLAREKAKLGGELAIVPISVQEKAGAVKRMAADLDLDYDYYLDWGGAARKAYAHSAGVPDIVVLDREHRVVARHAGLDPRIEALLTMTIRHALGAENPLLLVKDGYSGGESCGTCHTGQHETWSLTSHAFAFDTLVEHGHNRDAECLPCHVVGWGESGGYSIERPHPYLEGVQCESCHGRGGPHQSPEFAKLGYQAACDKCHTPEHSLRFAFAERLPLVSHAANRQFAGLSLEDRRALVARRDKRQRQLFEQARFVGSKSCEGCHANEYAIWSKSPHAHAFTSLEAAGGAKNETCQQCHTTGFAEPGGFPETGHDALGVGCESCHGPGGNHVGEGVRRDGTILALTDKCDSCVVLQICGSCHDDANDPGFEYEVLDKIELIRHGFRDREPEAAAE